MDKYNIDQEADVYNFYMMDFIDSLPDTQKAIELHGLIRDIAFAKFQYKPVILSIGACVIKCGLSTLIIDLIDRGYIQHIAMNSAAMIHDVEIALYGSTSEDINSDEFGMNKTTAKLIEWIGGDFKSHYLGESAGWNVNDCKYAYHSILHACCKNQITSSVHLSIGTDTPIIHFDPTKMAKKSYNDFILLSNQIEKLFPYGVFLNIGSAVIMPEVFLKSILYCKKHNKLPQNFTVANIDINDQYRAKTRLIDYPKNNLGCRTYDLRGNIEILLPLIAAGVKSV